MKKSHGVAQVRLPNGTFIAPHENKRGYLVDAEPPARSVFNYGDTRHNITTLPIDMKASPYKSVYHWNDTTNLSTFDRVPISGKIN